MRRVALVLSVGALAMAGCGGDGDQADDGSAQRSPTGKETTAADGAAGAVVDMNDQLMFEPKELEVAAGEKVSWKNVGKMAHTVTADKSKAADPALVSIPAGTKAWDSGFINEGESFSRAFQKPGTYRYICIPHEGARMAGTVVVK